MNTKLNLLVEALHGLTYLHTRKSEIVHGDIKGGNILISEYCHAQLSDFGLASVDDYVTTSLTGTARWMSPELFTGETARATTASDVWAFGCVMVEVLSGIHPYFEIDNIQRVILAITQEGKKPTRPTNAHDALWDLIQDCWGSPSDRPPAGVLLQRLRYVRGSQVVVLGHQ
ncbi:kinase-like protein [Exidia glandulosa HHB12029]|uniref:Kinase-like protein n=1 Tax=Exidia glandulosa HHB12029 TaxID=1314781 RepID=A0A165CQ07_EXIGL|nr:kinase-like protein [Exidia glandulosa HHB12029]